MAFFSVLAALAVEHRWPQRQPMRHYALYTRYASWVEHKFNAGEWSHGGIGWALALLPPVALAGIAFALLSGVAGWLGWVCNVVVLVATLGFKYYSDDAEAIARSLREQNLEQARAQLDRWRGGQSAGLDAEGIARLTLEQLMAASHRQMFGVLLWFVVLSGMGPIGAVLYRASSILARRWEGARGHFGEVAQRAFHIINWLPVRLTALTYAIAGNFEDATYCWRTQAPHWPEREEGVVLAAGAGAMGVRLGEPLALEPEPVWRPELGTGQSPDADSLDSGVSMIWRGLVIWLIAGLLFVVAGWVA